MFALPTFPTRIHSRTTCFPSERQSEHRRRNAQVAHPSSRFTTFRMMSNSLPPIETNSTPIPRPGLVLRTMACTRICPSGNEKCRSSRDPSATVSCEARKAPVTLKSSTRDVMSYFPNFHETHMPFGVGIRWFLLLSRCERGLISSRTKLLGSSLISLNRIVSSAFIVPVPHAGICWTGRGYAVHIAAT